MLDACLPVSRHADWLSDVQRANFERWDILGAFNPNRVVTGSDHELLLQLNAALPSYHSPAPDPARAA
jgi:hypothetical protein